MMCRVWSGSVAALGVWVGVAAAAVAADEKISIADAAPRDSFVVVGVDDWTRARTALEGSELGALWAEPTVQDFMSRAFAGEFGGEGEESLESWLRTIDVDPDELHGPSGAVGAAFFLKDPGPEAEGDAADVPAMHVLAIADFAGNAEAMEGVLVKMLEDMERSDRITIEEDEYAGATVRVVTFPEMEDEAEENGEADEDDEFADVEWDDEETGPIGVDALQTLRLARVGGTFVLSSHQRTLEEVIDRIGGRKMDAIGESRVYQDSLAQHPAEVHGHGVLILTDRLRSMLASVIAPDAPMGMTDDPSAMAGDAPAGMTDDQKNALLSAIGLGDFQSASIGVRFDAGGGIVEQTVGVLVPEKRGIFTLFDGSLGAFEPPPFAGADAASVSTLLVRFDRVVEVIRQVTGALPPEMQQEAQQFRAMAEGMAAPVLNALGSQVHIVGHIERPLSAGSQHQLMAVQVKDPLTVSNTITGLGAMAGGLEPRDFQGSQIFENPQGGPSIGLGAGYLFTAVAPDPQAAAADVENALRQAAQPGGPRLSTQERFRRAAALFGNDAMAYQYTDTRQSLEMAFWSMQNADKVLEAQLESLPEEMRAEFLEEFRANQPEWQKHLPPVRVLLDHIGDSIFEMRATPDGFRGRSVTLPPDRD